MSGFLTLAALIIAAYGVGCLLERFDWITRGWFGASVEHDYSRVYGDLERARDERGTR